MGHAQSAPWLICLARRLGETSVSVDMWPNDLIMYKELLALGDG